MRRTLEEAVLVVLFGLVVGAAVNAARPGGLPLSSDPRSLTVGRGIPILELPQAYAAFETGAVFVDARTRAAYVRGHVEGAIPLSPESYEADYREWWEFLPRDGRIVVYAGDREAAIAGARAEWMIRLGHQGASVLYDGWEAWERAGYPRTEGEE